MDVENQLNTPLLEGAGMCENESSTVIRKRPIGMKMDPSYIEEFKVAYGIDPIMQTSEYTGLNQHPHLAFQRNYLEDIVVKQALSTRSNPKSFYWMDIGSAPRRVLKPGKGLVRCLVPILQPGDADRSRGYTNNPNVCSHHAEQYLANIETGTCPNCIRAGAVMFTHSAYYMSAETMYKLIESTYYKTAYVIGHLFKEAAGTFGYKSSDPQASYHFVGANILMLAKGNPHQYRHPPLPWNDCNIVKTGLGNFEVTVMRHIGDTYLWQLSLTHLEPDVIDNSWRSLIVDNRYTGVIHIPRDMLGTVQSSLGTEVVTVPLDTLYGIGPVLYTTGVDDVLITMPRGLIGYITLECSFKERSPILLRTATHLAKNWLKSSPIPLDQQHQALVAAVVLGITRGVNTENQFLQHAVQHYNNAWRIHSQLLNLHPLKVVSIWFIILVGVTFFIASVIADHYFTNSGHQLAWLGGTIVFTGLLLALLLHCGNQAWLRNMGRSWVNTLLVDRRAEPVGTVPIEPFGMSGTQNFQVPPPVDEGAEVIVSVDPKPPKDPSNPPTRLQACGIIPDIVVSNVVEPNQKAEEAGIRNRITCPVPPINTPELELYNECIQNDPVFTKLKSIRIKDDRDLFNWWLDNSRYPQTIKPVLIEQYESIQNLGVRQKDAYLRSFVKLEQASKIRENGEKTTKPRMIQNPSDRYKVATGPFTKKLTDKICTKDNWHSPPIIYARGMRAEELGQVVDEFVESLGGWSEVIAIENDMEVYDSTVRGEHKQAFRDMFQQQGANPNTIQAYSLEVTKGVSKHGVKFKTKDVKINSGSNDTNVMGSLVNGAAHLSYPSLRQRKFPFLMLVMGDDNIIFLRRSDRQHTLGLNGHLRALGFKPVQLIREDRCDMEFCSKLFWPSEDGCLVTPKPGRVIARSGFRLTQAGVNEYEASLVGILQDCQHIPFVCEYLQTVRDLANLPAGDHKRVSKYMKSREEWMFFTVKGHKPNQETYEFVEKRYGLGINDLKAWKEVLSRIKKLPSTIDSSIIQPILDKDLA